MGELMSKVRKECGIGLQAVHNIKNKIKLLMKLVRDYITFYSYKSMKKWS
jgi:hypothetical protein